MKTNSSKPMKLTHSISIFTIGLLANALLPVAAAQPDADQILQQMSAKLAAAQNFSFKATREIDPALLAGRNVPENTRIVVTVQRPNKIAADSTSKYGVTPPLAEIALSNVYQDIHEKAQGVSYLGQATADGVTCHRLALAGKVADTELWVGVSDQLPRRLIATVKDRSGKPQLKVEFSDWHLT